MFYKEGFALKYPRRLFGAIQKQWRESEQKANEGRKRRKDVVRSRVRIRGIYGGWGKGTCLC